MREGKKKKTKFPWNTDEASVDLAWEGEFSVGFSGLVMTLRTFKVI